MIPVAGRRRGQLAPPSATDTPPLSAPPPTAEDPSWLLDMGASPAPPPPLRDESSTVDEAVPVRHAELIASLQAVSDAVVECAARVARLEREDDDDDDTEGVSPPGVPAAISAPSPSLSLAAAVELSRAEISARGAVVREEFVARAGVRRASLHEAVLQMTSRVAAKRAAVAAIVSCSDSAEETVRDALRTGIRRTVDAMRAPCAALVAREVRAAAGRRFESAAEETDAKRAARAAALDAQRTAAKRARVEFSAERRATHAARADAIVRAALAPRRRPPSSPPPRHTAAGATALRAAGRAAAEAVRSARAALAAAARGDADAAAEAFSRRAAERRRMASAQEAERRAVAQGRRAAFPAPRGAEGLLGSEADRRARAQWEWEGLRERVEQLRIAARLGSNSAPVGPKGERLDAALARAQRSAAECLAARDASAARLCAALVPVQSSIDTLSAAVRSARAKCGTAADGLGEAFRASAAAARRTLRESCDASLDPYGSCGGAMGEVAERALAAARAVLAALPQRAREPVLRPPSAAEITAQCKSADAALSRVLIAHERLARAAVAAEWRGYNVKNLKKKKKECAGKRHKTRKGIGAADSVRPQGMDDAAQSAAASEGRALAASFDSHWRDEPETHP